MRVVILGAETNLGKALVDSYADHDVVAVPSREYESVDLTGSNVYIHTPRFDTIFSYSRDPYDDLGNHDRLIADLYMIRKIQKSRVANVAYVGDKAVYSDSYRGDVFRLGEDTFARLPRRPIITRVFDVLNSEDVLHLAVTSHKFARIQISANEQSSYDFIRPADAARAIVLGIERRPPRPYDVGSGQLVYAKDIPGIVNEISGQNKPGEFRSIAKIGVDRPADVTMSARLGTSQTSVFEIVKDIYDRL